MKADIDNLKILKLKQSTLLRLERMSRIHKHIMAGVLHPRYETWTIFQNSRPTRKQQNSHLPHEDTDDSANPRCQYSATVNFPRRNRTPLPRQLFNQHLEERQSYILLMQRWTETANPSLQNCATTRRISFPKTNKKEIFQSKRTRDSGMHTHGCWEIEESRSSVRRWRCGSEEAGTSVSRERECAWSSWGLQSRPPNPNVPITFSLRSPSVAFVRETQSSHRERHVHQGTVL